MGKKTRKKLLLCQEDAAYLKAIISKRSSSQVTVQRATILLMYSSEEKITHIAKKLKTNRPLVERCIDKALAFGIKIALKDLPRIGRPRIITDEARLWVLSLACEKPTKFGYAAEHWTYSSLLKHVKKNYKKENYLCLAKLGNGRLNTILSEGNIKPHKVSYYLEKRDPYFEEKMARILYIYKEIEMINEGKSKKKKQVTISYDEKPQIQALKDIAPQLMPVPNKYPTKKIDHQYKRLGTVTLLAGIDLHTGRIIPLIRDKHRSKEFIEFLELLDKEYPKNWEIRIILDNLSVHYSKETKKYLLGKRGRFDFIFTPTHGSWLNLIEVFFSKIARSFLKGIRVETKLELIKRIYLGIKEINEEPVIFRWKYKLEDI